MKWTLRSLLSLAVAAGIALTGAAPAAATPSPAVIEAQIDKQWNQLEPIIEQYNGVHGRLVRHRAQIRALSARMAPLKAQVDVALRQVRGLAADAYMQGPPDAFNAMVITGSATGLTDKLTYLDQLARARQGQISGVARLLDRYATARTDLTTLTRSVAARDADLARKKKAIEAKLDNLQKLRVRAYGSASASRSGLRLGPCPVEYTNDRGGRAAQRACDLIGKPYVFGSEGPNSYDCSGLTKEAWQAVGVHLDHYTRDQWREGTPVGAGSLQPGDLVFYYPGSLHHVAIYIGGGMVVHAPHTGDYVRMATIRRGPIAGYRRPR